RLTPPSRGLACGQPLTSNVRRQSPYPSVCNLKGVHMSVLAPTVERLAQLGANLELTKGCKLLAPTIENIVQIVAARGGHVTVDADLVLAPTLERLVQIGGSHLTIRV